MTHPTERPMSRCAARRRHRALRAAMAFPAIAWTLWAIPLHAGPADFQVFNDRAHYSAVFLQQGRVQVDADWNEAEQGKIQQGQAFGIFRFAFDPAAVQPAVGTGIVGGLAVGAEPDGILGGDQGISLVVTPGAAINGFGVEIALAPFDGLVAGDVFRLVVGCPDPPCVFAGNPADLSKRGATFFLGVVANPGFAFDRVTLEAVTPRDESGEPIGSVPGWQIAAITFAPVPAPGTAILVAAGLCCLAAARRRAGRGPNGTIGT